MSKVINGLAVIALLGAFIFGNIWFWLMKSWAEAGCMMCVALQVFCMMFMEKEED